MAGSLTAALAARNADAAQAAAADAPGTSGTPFDAGTVKKLARDRAANPYKPADAKLPDALSKLDYDAYRTIRFDPAQALWHGAGLGFEAQFFHRGWLYPERVDIFEVADSITVLRLGQNVAEYKRSETNQQQVVEAITAGKLSKVPGQQQEAVA